MPEINRSSSREPNYTPNSEPLRSEQPTPVNASGTDSSQTAKSERSKTAELPANYVTAPPRFSKLPVETLHAPPQMQPTPKKPKCDLPAIKQKCDEEKALEYQRCMQYMQKKTCPETAQDDYKSCVKTEKAGCE